ncbi:hypothetical protein ACFP9V_16215 [Deinococcus radiopugnans]|uniref:hypothetical protein n=1 Tax=Deinococcus radiopugnans TaxID=57497 RepID=UPI00361376A6
MHQQRGRAVRHGAFGGLITGDLFTFGNVTTYALVGAEVQGSNTALQGGLGLRYGIALLPVEAYVEVGAQRISTALQPIIGPRLAVGVNYRLNVATLQGQIPAPWCSRTAPPTSTRAAPPRRAS